MKGLTPRQKQILDFITDSLRRHGFPPTIREIGDHMGIRSTNGVNDHLKALERKGFLSRDELKSRAMRPVGVAELEPVIPSELVAVPLLGRVTAGALEAAIEVPEDTVHMDRLLIGPHREVFALRVRGESMIDAGIHDGDYVFVKKTAHAEQGEIVVVLVDDEATCKRIFREGDVVRLQPENATMKPILIHRREFRETMVLGKVVGIYRRF
ncbi:MAG: transcriptional repressor LexA [bacterium]